MLAYRCFKTLSQIWMSESGDESEAECPGCGLVYGSLDNNEKWVQCDVC